MGTDDGGYTGGDGMTMGTTDGDDGGPSKILQSTHRPSPPQIRSQRLCIFELEIFIQLFFERDE